MFKYATVVVVERGWQLAAAVIVVVMMQSTMMLTGISGITSAINMIHDAAIDSVTVGISSNGLTIGAYQRIRRWTWHGVPRPVGGEAAIFIFFWILDGSQ